MRRSKNVDRRPNGFYVIYEISRSTAIDVIAVFNVSETILNQILNLIFGEESNDLGK